MLYSCTHMATVNVWVKRGYGILRNVVDRVSVIRPHINGLGLIEFTVPQLIVVIGYMSLQ